ncbi:hypothetical protein BJ878DRAFT_307377 [Calycina marina]|uniref:Serine/threonine-protein kinase ATG1 n=1 Tax=Calycina marina TaxID=1763456 RepID=A0A9P7Z6S7_9HELO|nr:hypothetical protein BJ878DRAFT_307377 [Calycina marina]
MATHAGVPSSSARRSRTGDKTIGKFLIGEQIGKGSFATVYGGKHKKTGALVAIKSVNLSKLSKKLKENLFCEIEILKGLQHPHIVALIDCHESVTHIHLVMEYCELGDLSYFIKKRYSLSDNDALKDMARKYPMPRGGGLNEVITRHFLKQLASAMEFLRERDFIHRDVKPQNLLILPSPRYLEHHPDRPLIMSASQESVIPRVGLLSLPMLKIADFGFARSLPKTSMAETLCGSPLYMAPEILRYEKYGPNVDLWSVGTVLFEMACGKPPFKAGNHVELLRKIEQSGDQIEFEQDVEASRGLKKLIRGLLKRVPAERMLFEDFFKNSVVVEPIPNLVGDDIPAVSKPRSQPVPGTSSAAMNKQRSESLIEAMMEREPRPSPKQTYASSPRDRPMPPSPRQPKAELAKPQAGTSPRQTQIQQSVRATQRPHAIHAATAPNAEVIQTRRSSFRQEDVKRERTRFTMSRESSTDDVLKRKGSMTQSEAEQAVRDARDYVLVEKRAVEVNAFADQLATMGTNPNKTKAGQTSSRTQITRRSTTQGNPASATGAVPASPSRIVEISQGRTRQGSAPQRPNSTSPKSFGISPSTTSTIANALNHASLRFFGVGWSPHLIGKGNSPDNLYSAFPAYPTSQGVAGLIADSKPDGPLDEDQKVVNVIEESATRSDVVYGFAEVKYKQLIPLAPSMDHGLGGPEPERSGESIDDDGLTIEAIVALSEEALVLYVKALTLLAKSINYAGSWWAQKNRGEVLRTGNVPRSDSLSAVAAGNRINSAVQWVRNRFNEVLEKAEFVRLKLIEAQKRLPADHPGHPNNHTSTSRIAGASSTGAVLSSGITAEKLMYDRAIEMSRSAAINEISNDDLQGCEISYITAIRMLEAVLENDDESPMQRARVSSLSYEMKADDESPANGIRLDDKKDVLKVVDMIKTRLATLRKKMAMIAKHNAMAPSSPRPASIICSGGTTPTLANTPPH